MDFTYASYERLIAEIKGKKYKIASYHQWEEYDRCVIFRHDVDYDLGKAVEFARLEYMWGGKVPTLY